jgi:hypothetical protein
LGADADRVFVVAKIGAEHKNLKDQRPAFCEKLQLFTVGLTV